MITQLDDHLGRLFRHLEARGRLDDTLIVFTADHGEFMGDHWLFEKELFHEQAVRVPFIVYDPSSAADATRGGSSAGSPRAWTSCPPASEARHGTGWTEWELIKTARPRFDGHRQPKVPVWGYEDESDPHAMARKIDAAADHGVTSFIFDWYWYEDGPALQRALEEGFLGAANNHRLKFSLMWANHHWINLFPASYAEASEYAKARGQDRLRDGWVSPEAFRAATDHMIENYFTHSSYWKVDGGLYFSIYDLSRLIEGLGGLEATRAALDELRKRVRAAGLGELHLNAVVRAHLSLPGEGSIDVDALEGLGFDSATPYVWVHLQPRTEFPVTNYAEYSEACVQANAELLEKSPLPFFPNVTMGWDASPRALQTDMYEEVGYPFDPTLGGNTPEEFEKSMRAVKDMLTADRKHPDRASHPRVLTINAWNEWTEGSYLEPDTTHQMGYLEAIKRVISQRQD